MFAPLARFTGLESLRLALFSLPQNGWAFLAALPHLTHLLLGRELPCYTSFEMPCLVAFLSGCIPVAASLRFSGCSRCYIPCCMSARWPQAGMQDDVSCATVRWQAAGAARKRDASRGRALQILQRMVLLRSSGSLFCTAVTRRRDASRGYALQLRSAFQPAVAVARRDPVGPRLPPGAARGSPRAEDARAAVAAAPRRARRRCRALGQHGRWVFCRFHDHAPFACFSARKVCVFVSDNSVSLLARNFRKCTCLPAPWLAARFALGEPALVLIRQRKRTYTAPSPTSRSVRLRHQRTFVREPDCRHPCSQASRSCRS